MPPRDVARAARRSIEIARERLRQGAVLLVFSEGTRSRTGGMQRMLVGATRYIEEPDTWVLPMGIAGTDALFPVGAERAAAVGDRRTDGAPVPRQHAHRASRAGSAARDGHRRARNRRPRSRRIPRRLRRRRWRPPQREATPPDSA